jgi:hypothetical protein
LTNNNNVGKEKKEEKEEKEEKSKKKERRKVRHKEASDGTVIHVVYPYAATKPGHTHPSFFFHPLSFLP